MTKINLFTKFDQIRPYLLEWVGVQLVRGVYFLCDGHTLLYVGSSVNIMARIGNHLRDRSFNRVYYLDFSHLIMTQVRSYEEALIIRLRPPWNKKSDPSFLTGYNHPLLPLPSFLAYLRYFSDPGLSGGEAKKFCVMSIQDPTYLTGRDTPPGNGGMH